ncbi:unnamed protein product [Urochloa humidicola]
MIFPHRRARTRRDGRRAPGGTDRPPLLCAAAEARRGVRAPPRRRWNQDGEQGGAMERWRPDPVSKLAVAPSSSGSAAQKCLEVQIPHARSALRRHHARVPLRPAGRARHAGLLRCVIGDVEASDPSGDGSAPRGGGSGEEARAAAEDDPGGATGTGWGAAARSHKIRSAARARHACSSRLRSELELAFNLAVVRCSRTRRTW